MNRDLYVSPNGTGDGSKTSPASMAGCNEILKNIIDNHNIEDPITPIEINVYCLQGQYDDLPGFGVNTFKDPKNSVCRFIGGYLNFDESPTLKSTLIKNNVGGVKIWINNDSSQISSNIEKGSLLKIINFNIIYSNTSDDITTLNYSLYNCTVKLNDNINQPYTQLFTECENCSLTGITTILSSVNSIYYESAGWTTNSSNVLQKTPLFENIGNSYINQNVPLTLYSEISCKQLKSPKGLILYGYKNPIIFKNNNEITYNYNSLSCIVKDSDLESYITNNEINVKYIKVDNQSNSNLYLSGNIFPVIDVKSYTQPFTLDSFSTVISSITLKGNVKDLNIYDTINLNNCNCEDQNISLNLLSANYTIADSEVNKLTTQTITSFSIGPAGGYIKFKPKKFTKIVYTY